MARGTYQERLRAAYRKVFKDAAGKLVLIDLYEKLHGKQTTMPVDGNPTVLAFNEGKRMALLIMMEHLREEDVDLRAMYETHLNEKRVESMNE